MKTPSLIFAFLLAFTLGCPASADESIVGKYKLEMEDLDNFSEAILECKAETSCTFTTTSTSAGTPSEDVQTLNNVHAVKNLAYARNALKYAIDHRTRKPLAPDAIDAMARLRPVLTNNPTISKCWDLNYPEPNYMLACTLAGTPPNSPPIYLFGTTMTNCNDVFCGYLIYPMSRIK